MKEIRQLKEKGKPDSVRERSDSGLVAAMRIQKVWRGFATRRKTRRSKLEEMYLIGMVPRPGPKNTLALEEKEKVDDFCSFAPSQLTDTLFLLLFSVCKCDTKCKMSI